MTNSVCPFSGLMNSPQHKEISGGHGRGFIPDAKHVPSRGPPYAPPTSASVDDIAQKRFPTDSTPPASPSSPSSITQHAWRAVRGAGRGSC